MAPTSSLDAARTAIQIAESDDAGHFAAAENTVRTGGLLGGIGQQRKVGVLRLGESGPVWVYGENIPNWSTDALSELNRVPGFVRGKVKRNVETFAIKNNIQVVTLEVMYTAKEAVAMT